MSVADELLAARDRIAEPHQWCQGTFFRDSAGTPVISLATWKTLSPDSRQACAEGALLADDTLSAGTTNFLQRVSIELMKANIYAVNDIMGHTAVMAVYDEAIRRAKDEGL